MITFEELVGDRCSFQRDYRGRAPLLRRGAVREPQHLISLKDLDNLLVSEAIRPPYLRVTKDGKRVREGEYTRHARVQFDHLNDVIEPRRVMDLFSSGATLIWASMNHYQPTLRQLATMIAGSLGCRTDVVAFVTPADTQGLNPHLDTTEVFVIQTSGRKRWSVWETMRPRPAAGKQLDPARLGVPILDVELTPGDFLYLPWGTPHVARSAEQASVHLTVSTRPRTWADVVAAVVRDALSGEDYQRIPVLSPDTVDETAAELSRLLSLTAEITSGLDTNEAAQALSANALPTIGLGESEFFSRQENPGQAVPHTRGRRVDAPALSALDVELGAR
jgi:lysine-specific demethylase/histidyl-hydroxylase NO66